MTTEQKISPNFRSRGFHCPYCKVYAEQKWGNWDVNLTSAQCNLCKEHSIWRGGKLVYPFNPSAPEASNGMPDSVKEIFDEARLVSVHSPRAAAALLRVALERLTVHLGELEGSLNTRIGNLRKQGLPDGVIKSLDIVRITANEGGAHAGTIDLAGEDGSYTVDRLFLLVNYIVEKAINEPARIKQMFEDLPADKRKGAEDRDKPKDKK